MLTHAKAGGPPDNWRGLRIIDTSTGLEISGVVEVNTVEGWLDRLKLDDEGSVVIAGDEAAIERLTGSFLIQEV